MFSGKSYNISLSIDVVIFLLTDGNIYVELITVKGIKTFI